jgi:hypothetical protein
MRNFTLLILAILAVANVSVAQRTIGQGMLGRPADFINDKVTTDTLFPPTRGATCDSFFVYATFNGSTYAGYLAGTNAFGDTEKAQKLANNQLGEVTAVIAVAGVIEGNGNYFGKVYVPDGTGKPGTLVATSAPVPASAIQATSGIGFFTMTGAQIPAGPFFAGITVNGAAGDSIALLTTEIPCGNKESYEKWSDGNWYTIFDAYSGQLDLDFAMGAIVQRNTGTENLSVFTNTVIFPNPVATAAIIAYTTKESGNITISVKNITGQTVMAINEGVQVAGNYNKVLDVKELAAGTYIYQVELNGKTAQGKFIVTK